MPDILVAIDMVAGEVVRLHKGAMDRKTVYGGDPVQTALEWQNKGARWLHLVDLDGATGTGIDNAEPIGRIVDSVHLPVQIGGGIRSMEAIEKWVNRGVARVCIGTKSMDLKFLEKAVAEFGDRLVASLDTRAGKVQVAGWIQGSETSTMDALQGMLDCGVRRIMFTDIERDGTLQGVNTEGIEQVLNATQIPVIAAGGVTDLTDIERLAPLASKGLDGIVIGKALYSGSIDLGMAQAALSEA
ncbi:MAG: 1-(5-phosphoribosyl)-5-[(5-phosphoribosylamino)methylideneamino]imidazole-4-carboxamide isomerase [Actinobacteria bacterium]|nr:1-(5-phosphoribosyl)-5-[(5-phosphoribosylamino)methylideneamino]imidazole-4-carboxamide isomerase [Actinomycetota bacterium]